MTRIVKLLASTVSVAESSVLSDLGVDILDVKNPAEGSLGAQPPWVVREIVQFAEHHGVAVSAAIGDLSFQPGTAALAADSVARLGVSFVKVGLYDLRSFDEATSLLRAVRAAIKMVDDRIAVVAAGYGDYPRFDGLSPANLIRAAAATGCQITLLDTAIKDGASLLDAISFPELEAFVQEARHQNLQVALAGSLRREHLASLAKLKPDFIGVRGALCSGNVRSQSIDPAVASEFVRAVRVVFS